MENTFIIYVVLLKYLCPRRLSTFSQDSYDIKCKLLNFIQLALTYQLQPLPFLTS